MIRTLTEPVELSFISMEEVMAWYCAFTSCTMLDESDDRVPSNIKLVIPLLE